MDTETQTDYIEGKVIVPKRWEVPFFIHNGRTSGEGMWKIAYAMWSGIGLDDVPKFSGRLEEYGTPVEVQNEMGAFHNGFNGGSRNVGGKNRLMALFDSDTREKNRLVDVAYDTGRKIRKGLIKLDGKEFRYHRHSEVPEQQA